MAPGPQIGNQYTTAAYSISPAPPPSDRPAPLLDLELDRMQEQIHGLLNLAERTRGIADRLFGCEPTPLQKTEPANVKAEVIPVTVQLSMRLTHVDELLNALRHQVVRLESL